MTDFYNACKGLSDNNCNVEDFLKAGAPVNDPISEDYGINHRGFTPLHLAVMYNNTIAVEVLLRYGANVNLKSEDGHTPLHVAFWVEAYVIVDLILEYMSTVAAISLENSVDSTGLSHFHIACIGENLEVVTHVVETFIQNNVDVNAAVSMDVNAIWAGYTPLHFAIKSPTIINLLLEHGAAVNARDAEGYTPLHVAMRKNGLSSTVEALLKNDADVNAVTLMNETVIIIAAKVSNWTYFNSLVKYEANLAVRDSSGHTLLQIICYDHSDVIAKMLLENGANVNAIGPARTTALHATVSNAETTFTLNSTPQNEIIGELVVRGCDVNARDIRGCTALHYACQNGNAVGALSLLKRGADIDLKDNFGNTPRKHYLEAYNRGQFQVTLAHLCFTEISRICGARRDSIAMNSTNPFFENMRNNCMKELNSMKTTVIDRITSLDQILVKSRNQMARYVNNNKIQKIGKSIEIEKLFPIYGPMIIKQINEGYSRRRCLGRAHDAFRALTLAYYLPDTCAERIFDNLKDDDLRNIIKAAKLID